MSICTYSSFLANPRKSFYPTKRLFHSKSDHGYVITYDQSYSPLRSTPIVLHNFDKINFSLPCTELEAPEYSAHTHEKGAVAPIENHILDQHVHDQHRSLHPSQHIHIVPTNNYKPNNVNNHVLETHIIDQHVIDQQRSQQHSIPHNVNQKITEHNTDNTPNTSAKPVVEHHGIQIIDQYLLDQQILSQRALGIHTEPNKPMQEIPTPTPTPTPTPHLQTSEPTKNHSTRPLSEHKAHAEHISKDSHTHSNNSRPPKPQPSSQQNTNYKYKAIRNSHPPSSKFHGPDSQPSDPSHELCAISSVSSTPSTRSVGKPNNQFLSPELAIPLSQVSPDARKELSTSPPSHAKMPTENLVDFRQPQHSPTPIPSAPVSLDTPGVALPPSPPSVAFPPRPRPSDKTFSKSSNSSKHSKVKSDSVNYPPYLSLPPKEISLKGFNDKIELALRGRHLRPCMDLYALMKEHCITPNLTTFHLLFSAHIQTPSALHVNHLFLDLVAHKLKPTSETYMLLFAANAEQPEYCDKIYEHMRAAGIAPTVDTVRKLIVAHLRKTPGEKQSLKRTNELLWDLLPSPSAQIHADSSSSSSPSTISRPSIFSTSPDVTLPPFPPDILPHLTDIFNKILAAVPVDGVVSVFEAMRARGVSPNTITYNTLLSTVHTHDTHTHADAIEEEIAVVEEMQSQGIAMDVVTYNTLLSRAMARKEVELCKDLYTAMAAQGLEPNIVTYKSLTLFMAKMGEHEHCWKIVRDMQNNGWV